jgi:hypothetical protein
MLREANSFVAPSSSHSSQKHAASLPASCILCRVLWPRVLQHRHLVVDAASEAKTIVNPPVASRR